MNLISIWVCWRELFFFSFLILIVACRLCRNRLDFCCPAVWMDGWMYILYVWKLPINQKGVPLIKAMTDFHKWVVNRVSVICVTCGRHIIILCVSLLVTTGRRHFCVPGCQFWPCTKERCWNSSSRSCQPWKHHVYRCVRGRINRCWGKEDTSKFPPPLPGTLYVYRCL